MAGSSYIVSSGAFSSGIELNEKDYLYVLSGGVNTSAVVNSGGMLLVSGGGADYGAVVNSDGVLHGFGYVGGAKLEDGGLAYVYTYGSANNITVKSNAEMVVLTGGKADGVKVASGGSLIVSSGASASTVTVESGGFIEINLASNTSMTGTSAGTGFSYFMSANGINIDATKALNIYDGALGNTLRVNLHGKMNVYAGGSANVVEVTSGGDVQIHDGGKANRFDVKNGGSVTVHAGGYIEGAAVSGTRSKNGVLEVSGSAYRTVVSSGGRLDVAESGHVNSSVISSGGSIKVLSGAVALQTEVGSSGSMVINGGVTEQTTVGWRGEMIVSNGSAVDAVLNSSSYMAVYSGGSSINFAAATGARFGVHVAPGTYLSGTSKTGDGTLATVLLENGIFKDLTYSGNLWVHDSGRAENLTVISGSGAVSSGGQASNITLQEVAMTVSKGGSMSDVEVHSAGKLHVRNGGYVSEAVVSRGGEMYVSNNASADKMTVASNAHLRVSSGAAVGEMTILNGGYINGIKVLTDNSCSGSVNISSALVSAVSNSLVSNFSGTAVSYHALLDGAQSASVVEVRYGGLTVVNGASASNVTVNSSGVVSAIGSATALDSVKVNASGYVLLIANAVGNNIEITDGGWAEVIYGGRITNSLVSDGGCLQLDESAVADAVTVSAGGAIDIYSTAKFTGITAETGAWVNGFELKEQNVYNGNLIIKNAAAGSAVLMANQMGVDITIDAGAVAVVETGAVLSNVSVGKNGELQLNHGAVLTGSITLSEGAYVNALGGSLVVFDVSSCTISSDVLLNDLSLLYGSPDYSILVDAMQGNGTYKLANNAKNFLETVTIGDKDGEYGEISVNGRAFYHHDMTYRLENIAGKLTLTVAGSPTYMTGDFDGSGSDMLVNCTADGLVGIYSQGELWKTVTLDEGMSVFGVGDFNADGIADLLLKDAAQGIYAGFGDGSGSFEVKLLGNRTAGWRLAGIGDFDNDGYDDVMFAKDDAASEQLGLFGYWDLGKESNNWALVDGYDNSWEVIASGDFNGDGTTDMLWKNDFIGDESMHFNGYCTWSMNPVDNPVWQMVSIANPFEWNFLTVGDFNGDGTDDIAMINGEGMVGIWTMNKGTVAIADGDAASWTILNKVDDPEAWTLAEVGDFNGDGTDDIAWCNVETGLCGYWQIENNQTKSWNVIANLA